MSISHSPRSRFLMLALVASMLLPLAATNRARAGDDPQRSTTSRLADKRYVAAGDRAYLIGTADGGFPAMGWHIRGEMGGIWAHPIKLLDGYWFRVAGGWLPEAERFTSHPAYVELDYPRVRKSVVERIDFSPDGRPVVLTGLTISNPTTRARSVKVTMDVRSEIMAAYPWGWSQPQDAGAFNGPDRGSYDPATGSLAFQEQSKTWHAVVQSSVRPEKGAVGDQYWGPNSPAEQEAHSEYGNGTGGQLVWRVNVPAAGERKIWIATAGSTESHAGALAAAQGALVSPEALLADKSAARRALLDKTDVSLPDEGLEAAFDWGKLNMADLRRTVFDAEIRDVDEGRAYPPPIATIPELTGIGAGYPDYPWYFGTDGAYTAWPLIASGQWGTAMEHLRSIKDVSRIVNGDTGKVVHEVVTDGSVYFGTNDDPGNTNETAQFAVAVDLVWRWTGNNAFRDEMYDFVSDGMRYVTSELDQDNDLWPEGFGMVERPGMGSEKLDVTVYTWQALNALARMATARGDLATATWAKERADAMAAEFDGAWWMEDQDLYADSLCNAGDEVSEEEQQENGWTNVCEQADQQLQQRHWINATPMETTIAPEQRAAAALDRLESDTFTGECGLFHTGRGGGPAETGELKCWTLPNSVMAVAEASYGRLADDQALTYMKAIASELDLEQPGALPEISPSPEYDPFVDFRDRAMFMQAWSSYGVQWPVIHHFIGVRPDAPNAFLSVIPDIPDSWPGLSVDNLQVGDGAVGAAAARDGSTYSTTVAAPAGWSLEIGHVLPPAASVQSVTLDGAPVEYEIVDTNRGREVRVQTTTGTEHVLVVQAG